MLGMNPKPLALALVPIIAALTFAGVFFFFNQGTYDPPPSPEVQYEQISIPGVAPVAATDSGRAGVRGGLLAIDTAHFNFFSEREIATLTSWVADRSYEVELVGNFRLIDREERFRSLEDALRRADSFLVMLPRTDYSEAEIRLVERFVDKGGKLVLVSDPTRNNRINSLAKRFGVAFEPDYLYNTEEYDLNFRHIFVRDFQPSPLTSGLGTIALYIAGSVQSSGDGLAFTDTNTRSSLGETAEVFTPISLGDRRNVLAISDFTFMVPPHHSLVDNGKLLSNLADFITDGQRVFDLDDFPYFYPGESRGDIDILLGQPSLWDVGLEMRTGLTTYGISSGIRAEEDVSRGTVFLGLYEDSGLVSPYLQLAGVSIDDGITLPFASGLHSDGTALVLLHREQDRYVLAVLGDTPDDLADAVGSLFSGEFRNELVSKYLGLHGSP